MYKKLITTALALVLAAGAHAGTFTADFSSGDFDIDNKYGDLARYSWELGDAVAVQDGKLVYTCSSSFEASVVQFENPLGVTGDFTAQMTVDFAALLADANVGQLSWISIIVHDNTTYRVYNLLKDNGYYTGTPGVMDGTPDTWVVAAHTWNHIDPAQIQEVTATSTVTLKVERVGNQITLYAGYDGAEPQAVGPADTWAGDPSLRIQFRGGLATTTGESYTGGTFAIDDIIITGDQIAPEEPPECFGPKYDELLAAATYFDWFAGTDNHDGSTIPDAFEWALVAKAVCENLDAQAAWDANMALLTPLAEGIWGPGEFTTNWCALWAAYSTMGDEGLALAEPQTTLYGVLHPWDTASKTATQPLSPSGDYDQDGLTNEEEYALVLQAGGGALEYAEVASDADQFWDGNPNLPAASLTALGVLSGLLAVVGGRRIRRRW